MSARYLVEIKTELSTSITIQANSQGEAIEKAYRQLGQNKDIYPGEVKVTAVHRLDR
jgi:ribosomal protein L20A (L18A)